MFGGYYRYNYVKNLYYLREFIPDFLDKLIHNNLRWIPTHLINKYNLSKGLKL